MRGLLFCLIVSVALSANSQNFGNPLATTVQLPTFGVSFDADGVLEVKAFEDPGGLLIQQKLAAARKEMVGNLARPVKNRKVSLVRLEAALANQIDRGAEPTEAMLCLAGMTRITSVFCYPDKNDIVISGPAEPWLRDLGGSPVGLVSGRPVLRLEDLVVALRAFKPANKAGEKNPVFVGCTINPRAESLAKLVEFQKQIPRSISDRDRGRVGKWIAEGVRDSLGMADVVVFGIDPRTNFARVMIEADYRMKRIAVGVESPPIKMTTFAEALTSARNGALERWWFTPKYDGIVAAPDRLAMKIDGQGVQLQTENKEILATGVIVDSGRGPTRAARVYASNFTKSYAKISEAAQVYGQLRQLTDFLIAAAFMRKNDWYKLSNWQADRFTNEAFFTVNTMNNPNEAPAVVNAFWKQRRFFSPAGGGVSIEAEKALESLEEDTSLNQLRKETRPEANDGWWWD